MSLWLLGLREVPQGFTLRWVDLKGLPREAELMGARKMLEGGDDIVYGMRRRIEDEDLVKCLSKKESITANFTDDIEILYTAEVH